MGKPATVAVSVLVIVVVVVAADVLLFRHQLWPRLLANIGIVLLIAALYLRFRSRL